MRGNYRSGKALVASRRNLGMRDCSRCIHCGQMVPDVFLEEHLKVRHGITE